MADPDPDPEQTDAKSGLPSALGAYTIWGFFPLYLILVSAVPPFEFVAWRIIWTVPICAVIVLVRRQWPQVRAALSDWKVLRWLLLSSVLIAINWGVYVWAIQRGNVYAASLGYYINPLFNVLLGTLVLGESKREVQTDTAVSITTVDQEEIDDRQEGTVAELIDSVPGVSLVNGSTPQGSGINIRGFGANPHTNTRIPSPRRSPSGP